MNKLITKFLLTNVALFCCATVFFQSTANGQRRDYFTDKEIELVRDANEIDRRIDVLVKAIDRRMLVVNNDNTQTKQVNKDQEKWGELPTGTRLELLSDISKIFEKAIDDIDDLADRKAMNDEIGKANVENETDEITKRLIKDNDKKFPVAVHNLADAARRLLPIFETMNNNVVDEKEKGALLRSIEFCGLIIDASTQIARPVDKKRKS